MPKFYLTTPLYYVNARPHVGHTYSTIVADTITRYKRMMGYEVCFLTGTDEHGEHVGRAARVAGRDPQSFVDEIARDYKRVWDRLGLRYDQFIRTTESRHKAAVWKIFRAVQKAGYIYEGTYVGQYCVNCELYVTDPTPEGNCPNCGRPPESVEEENYFFKLSAFQEPLLAHYRQHPEFIQPEARRNEVEAFVRGGLRDLSISRTRFRWGIPVPEAEDHVFYVWFDALTGYISGIGYGSPDAEAPRFNRFWPADLQLVGKEIVRFHAVYWPAFLMAAALPLPRTIYAHGWWLFQQDKMSKSRGNIVRPEPIAEVIGVDALRYFLLREMVFGQDANFSYDALVTRYNSDLANDYGNLAARTLVMIERYFQGAIPEPAAPPTKGEEGVAKAAERAIGGFCTALDRYDFSRGLEAVWELVATVNKYLVETEPWRLAEEGGQRERLGTILWTAAEGLRVATALLHPEIPDGTQRVWEQLGQKKQLGEYDLAQLSWGQLSAGTRIGKLEAIYPRAEKEVAIRKMVEREANLNESAVGASKGGKTVSNNPSVISMEEFAKVDMRVGEVRAAERVPGADKLLKLRVDIGDEERQIVAGIAEVYAPQQLVGKKIVVVVNLQPRKIRGIESQGMLVAATVEEAGKPVIATFTEDVPAGARLK
jgi:methionyl-tRNA synthetase